MKNPKTGRRNKKKKAFESGEQFRALIFEARAIYASLLILLVSFSRRTKCETDTMMLELICFTLLLFSTVANRGPTRFIYRIYLYKAVLGLRTGSVPTQAA